VTLRAIRYVVVEETVGLTDHFDTYDLPDAEHIHVHIAADGIIKVTPLVPYHGRLGDGRTWVDAPTGGES
jgi:hypothetical protein